WPAPARPGSGPVRAVRTEPADRLESELPLLRCLSNGAVRGPLPANAALERGLLRPGDTPDRAGAAQPRRRVAGLPHRLHCLLPVRHPPVYRRPVRLLLLAALVAGGGCRG